MKVEEIEISSILVEDRFRKDLGAIDELTQSIKEKGLIQPITVSNRLRLLAGGRRLEAAKRAGLTSIPAVVRDTEGEIDEKEIELFENIHRKDLSWQERARLEATIYDLRKSSVRDVAGELGIAKSLLHQNITLARVLDKIPEIATAKTASDAWKTLKGLEEKIVSKAIAQKVEQQIAAKVEAAGEEGISPELMLFHDAAKSYRLGDALKGMDLLWQDDIKTWSFDFAEVDPPYGIDFDKLKERRLESAPTVYTDDYTELSSEEHKPLIEEVAHRVHSYLKDNTFCVWWFGIQHYQMIYDTLSRAGFGVNPVPCIWVKEGAPGQTLRPEINFGSVYEVFFVARKGAPLLMEHGRGRSNVFSYKQVAPANKIHNTEKPPELMDELLRCFCSPGSRILIPFMGSGATLAAAYRANSWGVGWDVEENVRNRFLLRMREGVSAIRNGVE